MDTRPLPVRHRLGRSALSRVAEAVARGLIVLSGWIAIGILTAIAVFLLVNALPALRQVGLWRMVSGTDWYPTSDPPAFGFLPAETGSLWVTGVAILLAVPIGVAAAVFISEFTKGGWKDTAKALIEFMAAVPSVVYGLLGIAILVTLVKDSLRLDTGLTAFTAGLVVAFMALPTIISISEDALHAVPEDLRMGSLALGNTRWQTVYKVVIPSASSGIFAAVMLGLGRAIGETMVVLMLAGNANVIASSPLQSVATLPARIAAEMGEAVQGGIHSSALFGMGLVLFTVTFLINLAADVVLDAQRKKWRR